MPDSHRRPSTLAWMLVHLIFPLLPFILAGLIRAVVLQPRLTLDTFNSATLMMSLGLICIFINQSLRSHSIPLPDADERESLAATAMLFLLFAIIAFVAFGVIVLLQTLVLDKAIEALAATLALFRVIAFAGSVVPIVAALAVQRSFKLRASMP